MNDKELHKLEEVIEELEEVKGRHTELVSVLIPVGQNIFTVTKQLESEKSTASNIKSKQTRSAVIDSLDSIIRELKNYKKTPENGLALYAGNISQKEGALDIEIWAIEPPKPLKVRAYRCDQTFLLDPLKDMLQADEVYGLLVIDRKEATIGLLEGKEIKVLRHLTSGVPGKIRAGGQSSQRFARIIEGLAKDFFRRVADSMKELLFDLPRLKGILVGGPVPTKDDFLDEGHLVTKLKEKVMATKDIGYTDEHGLHLLVEASQENLAEQEIIKEKQILERFFNTLGKEKEKAVYGEKDISTALERGAAEIFIVSKKLIKENPKAVKELEKKAEGIGAEVIVVSMETEEGEQFYNITKGIGALLRFALE